MEAAIHALGERRLPSAAHGTHARNRALWRLAQQAGEQLGLTLGEARAGGASDGNEASLFSATLDGLGPVGDGAHAAHEHIVIDKLIERTALLALLLMAD